MPPPGESKLDPTLAGLISRLRKIVAARDHVALEALMAPTFRVEFDAGKGPAAFQRHWRPESGDSRLWEVLTRLLTLEGYSYTETLFETPYVCARFPFDLDPLRYVVAVKKEVALIAEPRPEAGRLASPDYPILPLAKPVQPPVMIPPGSYVEVIHPSAGRCFVSSDDVYSPAAHRAFFEKRAGRWVWISLVAATLADPPDLQRHRSA